MIKIIKKKIFLKKFIFYSETRSQNFSRQLKSSFFTFTAFIVLLCSLLGKIPKQTLINYLGNEVTTQIHDNLVLPYEQLGSYLPDEYEPYMFFFMIGLFFFLLIVSKLINRKKPTLSRKQIKALNDRREFLQNHIKNKKVILKSKIFYF